MGQHETAVGLEGAGQVNPFHIHSSCALRQVTLNGRASTVTSFASMSGPSVRCVECACYGRARVL